VNRKYATTGKVYHINDLKHGIRSYPQKKEEGEGKEGGMYKQIESYRGQVQRRIINMQCGEDILRPLTTRISRR
jgi:hypothetical protein